MQEKEFEKLMVGEPAKWAFLTEMKSPITKEEVQKHERPIPIDKLTEIELFIEMKRKNGMSEKNIRKAVKRKFHIKVVI